MTQEELTRKLILETMAAHRDSTGNDMENAEAHLNALRDDYQKTIEAFDLAENDFVALIEKNTGAM